MIRLTYLLLVLLLAAGCGSAIPSKNRIEKDSTEYLKTMINSEVLIRIVSVGPGEGDSDNVYQHIVFDIEAENEMTFTTGPLQGKHLNKGQSLKNGELVILYQKENKDGKKWMPTKYELKRVPN